MTTTTPEVALKHYRFLNRDQLMQMQPRECGNPMGAVLTAMSELVNEGKALLCNVIVSYPTRDNLVSGWIWLDGEHDDAIREMVSKRGNLTMEMENAHAALQEILGDLPAQPIADHPGLTP